MLMRLLFEGVLGVLQIAIGFGLVAVRGALLELRGADQRTAEKITAIEVLVAAHYLTREEFATSMRLQTETILRAVDRQQAQIDGKQDKAR